MRQSSQLACLCPFDSVSIEAALLSFLLQRSLLLYRLASGVHDFLTLGELRRSSQGGGTPILGIGIADFSPATALVGLIYDFPDFKSL
jgi:hypothetical protein